MMVSRKLLVMALAVVCVVSVCVTTALAQPGGRGGRGGRGGGMAGGLGGGGGGLTGLLARPEVQKELELVPEQITDLQKLGEGGRDRMREMFSGLQDIEDREERMTKMRELMEKAQADLEKEISKILLPHQMKRLKQLAFQQRLRGGAGRALVVAVAGDRATLVVAADALKHARNVPPRMKTKATRREGSLSKSSGADTPICPTISIA